jgi:hypothetical protein
VGHPPGGCQVARIGPGPTPKREPTRKHNTQVKGCSARRGAPWRAALSGLCGAIGGHRRHKPSRMIDDSRLPSHEPAIDQIRQREKVLGPERAPPAAITRNASSATTSVHAAGILARRPSVMCGIRT